MNWRFTASEGSQRRLPVPDPARRRSRRAARVRSGPVRYRFLWSPRWIIGHLIVIALAITMVELGFWQLRRLHEKEHRRDTLRTELAASPVPPSQTPHPVRF